MNQQIIVESKIETIRTIFQDAKTFAQAHHDCEMLINYLENTSTEFRSVAYEGAAMAIAQKDFLTGNTSFNWNQLVSAAGNQSGHVHVGLGWAVAATPNVELSFINTIHPMMQFRIWDGCGYYKGVFKHRMAVKNQLRPEFLKTKDFQAFDQGLGRSLWYCFKGDIEKVAQVIQNFSVSRHADLWRGVGIASVYVGGCDESTFQSLSTYAGKFNNQLAIGVSMVARSRILANSFTSDTETACNVWCNMNAKEVMELAINLASSAHSFESWLTKMENEITNSKEEYSLS